MSIEMQFCLESIEKIIECDESSAKFIIDFDVCGFAIPWKYLNKFELVNHMFWYRIMIQRNNLRFQGPSCQATAS